MKWFFYAAGLVALILFSLWLNSRPFWNGDAAAAILSIPTSPSNGTRQSLSEGRTLPLVSITGTVVMDYSAGKPAVPYIWYTDGNGKTATKQLINAGERGCAPTAGDLPCVPGYPADAAYPKVIDGQRVIVDGYLFENRLLVTNIQSS